MRSSKRRKVGIIPYWKGYQHSVPEEVVFLLDVDNTLLDNDHIGTIQSHHHGQELGEQIL